MPNTKSAKKSMKTSEVRRVANKSTKSFVNSSRKKLYNAMAAKEDKAACTKLFSEYVSNLDKAVKKGVVKANNASRRKSRAAAKLASVA